jgi:hypothetical protein
MKQKAANGRINAATVLVAASAFVHTRNSIGSMSTITGSSSMTRLRHLGMLAVVVAFSSLLAAQSSGPQSAFHKLQNLAGDWIGTDDSGKEAKTSFKVVVGNTAVLETLVADGMEEMLTLYTVDGDGIALVHYCPTNNQPRMRALPGKGEVKELVFSFQSATNLASTEVGHEHRLILQFEDEDHIVEHWTWRKAGHDSEMVYKFARRKN